MWKTNYFTEDSLIKWGKKADGKKRSNVNTYDGELYQDSTQFSRFTAGKRSKFDLSNNIKEESSGIKKEENKTIIMFSMMHQ